MASAANPKKDVIYIDTEDDITAVIGKVKAAKASIVALVPPKRIGALQSIVNLKLLNRAAESAKKRIVLITNDHTLVGMAGGLAIPVAKNLQSKPEVPETGVPTTSDTDDDVINGDELPVGELEKTSDTTPVISPAAAAAAATNLEDDKKPLAATAAARAPRKKPSGKVIPNFDSFRKRIFIFGGLGVLLLVFLVWAIFFAGKATVAITAKTNVVNINKSLQLRPNATLDTNQGIAPAVVKEVKKAVTTDFGATGKKDVGTKASGAVRLSNSGDSDPVTVSAGTVLTSTSGATYATNASVTVPGARLSGGKVVPGTASVNITATANGANYNGATGAMTGAQSGIGATITTSPSGGTDKTISIVSQDDFNKAKEQLEVQANNESAKLKEEVSKQFTPDIVVIQESFKAGIANATSVPAVDQEAANAKMSGEATYRMVGIKRSDLKAIYDAYTKSQIDKATQKIYKSGEGKTAFAQFTEVEGGFTTKAQATAQVGPNINEQLLAQSMTGKRAGEIQEMIQRVQGVDNVDVRFSPFWVTKAPKDTKKIDIKFVVNDD